MSDVHTEDIKNLLDKSKIQHTEVVMYRTVSNDLLRTRSFDYDMLVFFSPAGVSSLKKNFPDSNRKKLRSEHSVLQQRKLCVTPDFAWTWKLPVYKRPLWRQRSICSLRRTTKESERYYELWIIGYEPVGLWLVVVTIEITGYRCGISDIADLVARFL